MEFVGAFFTLLCLALDIHVYAAPISAINFPNVNGDASQQILTRSKRQLFDFALNLPSGSKSFQQQAMQLPWSYNNAQYWPSTSNNDVRHPFGISRDSNPYQNPYYNLPYSYSNSFPNTNSNNGLLSFRVGQPRNIAAEITNSVFHGLANALHAVSLNKNYHYYHYGSPK